MKYNTGPYSTNSPIYDFCKAHGFEIKEKLFERYGWFCYSELNSDEAIIFKLHYPGRNFWTAEEFANEP
jgi:hypothetical protein